MLLVEAKFPATVRVTLNHHNINDLDNIARLLIDDVGLQSFSTNEVAAMGSARCYGENISLSKDERLRAMKKLTELNEQYGGRIEGAAGPLALAREMNDIEQRLSRGETEIPGRGMLCSCGGVFDRMAVLHDGSMVPWQLAPDAGYGGYRNALPPRCMAQLSGDQCGSPSPGGSAFCTTGMSRLPVRWVLHGRSSCIGDGNQS